MYTSESYVTFWLNFRKMFGIKVRQKECHAVGVRRVKAVEKLKIMQIRPIAKHFHKLVFLQLIKNREKLFVDYLIIYYLIFLNL